MDVLFFLKKKEEKIFENTRRQQNYCEIPWTYGWTWYDNPCIPTPGLCKALLMWKALWITWRTSPILLIMDVLRTRLHFRMSTVCIWYSILKCLEFMYKKLQDMRNINLDYTTIYTLLSKLKGSFFRQKLKGS